TADPIYLASNIIQFIQGIASRFNNPATPVVITVGQICAGDANKVIPDECSFGGTIRSFSEDSIKLAQKMIENYIGGLTGISGAECELEYTKYCPGVINNPDRVDELVHADDDHD